MTHPPPELAQDLESPRPVDAGRQQLLRRWYDQGWYSSRTVGDEFRDSAKKAPGQRVVFATADTESQLTLSQIHDESLSVAAGLQRLGVRPGDTVAVQLTNGPECVIAYQAALLCGAILVPIVHIYGAHEVSFILEESRASVLIAPTHIRSTVHTDRFDGYRQIATLKHIVAVGSDGDAHHHLRWCDLHADQRRYDRPTPVADDVCLLIYTSGTTSAPKGVQHSHNSFLSELRSTAQLLGGGTDDVQLVSFPPGHIAGAASIFRCLTAMTNTVFVDGWNPQRTSDLINRHGVTATAGTPFHLEGLLEVGGAHANHGLREMLLGAAGVSADLGRRAAAAGITTFRCYGLTEHPTITAGRPDDRDTVRLSTDGRPLPGATVRILDADGRAVGAGIEGEVVVRGPDQFVGYRDPALDAETFTPDGWLRTGDLGSLDADGLLTITDRIKDVVIRAGETISAGQVEEVLGTHPAVAEAAVVAAPHPRYGDVVAGVVVLRPDAHLDLDEVRRHFATAGLASQKTPERLVIVEELPRTALGKVRRVELRDTHFPR